MHQQLWRYKVEEKIYLGTGERKRLNITALDGTETEIGIITTVIIVIIVLF
jgi:hypothetical protein